MASDEDSETNVSAPKRRRLVAAPLESSLGIDNTAQAAVANGTSLLTRPRDSVAVGVGILDDAGVSIGDSRSNSIRNARGAHGVPERCSGVCATDAVGTASDDDSEADVSAPQGRRLVAAPLESSLGLDNTAQAAVNDAAPRTATQSHSVPREAAERVLDPTLAVPPGFPMSVAPSEEAAAGIAKAALLSEGGAQPRLALRPPLSVDEPGCGALHGALVSTAASAAMVAGTVSVASTPAADAHHDAPTIGDAASSTRDAPSINALDGLHTNHPQLPALRTDLVEGIQDACLLVEIEGAVFGMPFTVCNARTLLQNPVWKGAVQRGADVKKAAAISGAESILYLDVGIPSDNERVPDNYPFDPHAPTSLVRERTRGTSRWVLHKALMDLGIVGAPTDDTAATNDPRGGRCLAMSVDMAAPEARRVASLDYIVVHSLFFTDIDGIRLSHSTRPSRGLSAFELIGLATASAKRMCAHAVSLEDQASWPVATDDGDIEHVYASPITLLQSGYPMYASDAGTYVASQLYYMDGRPVVRINAPFKSTWGALCAKLAKLRSGIKSAPTIPSSSPADLLAAVLGVAFGAAAPDAERPRDDDSVSDAFSKLWRVVRHQGARVLAAIRPFMGATQQRPFDIFLKRCFLKPLGIVLRDQFVYNVAAECEARRALGGDTLTLRGWGTQCCRDGIRCSRFDAPRTLPLSALCRCRTRALRHRAAL